MRIYGVALVLFYIIALRAVGGVERLEMAVFEALQGKSKSVFLFFPTKSLKSVFSGQIKPRKMISVRADTKLFLFIYLASSFA